jgi:hypothetical protein
LTPVIDNFATNKSGDQSKQDPTEKSLAACRTL